MRHEIDHCIQRIDRSGWTARQIQDHGFTPHPTNSAAEGCKRRFFAALKTHLFSHSFEQAIDRALGQFASRIEQGARTVPMMMAALSAYHAGMSQVVIAGDRATPGTRALIDVVRGRYLPFAVTIPLADLEGPRRAAIERLLPWAETMIRDEPTAFVCRDFACLTPASSAGELGSQLDQGAP